jgi:hypothetical protein
VIHLTIVINSKYLLNVIYTNFDILSLNSNITFWQKTQVRCDRAYGSQADIFHSNLQSLAEWNTSSRQAVCWPDAVPANESRFPSPSCVSFLVPHGNANNDSKLMAGNFEVCCQSVAVDSKTRQRHTGNAQAYNETHILIRSSCSTSTFVKGAAKKRATIKKQ